MTDDETTPQDDQQARERHREPHRDARTGQAAAANRMANQQSWVEQQLRVAMEKGDFDDLPGAGKPLTNLGKQHDPDWWLKQLVEREQIAVLPPSLQLRKDDAELDALVDGLAREDDVRRELEDFNARVMRARYSPQDGQPPLVTMPRDVDDELTAWRGRRIERRNARRPVVEGESAADAADLKAKKWWRRSRK